MDSVAESIAQRHMNEREINQLLKLLDKFRLSTEADGTVLNVRERGVVSLVRQWVAWYGHDELSMDV